MRFHHHLTSPFKGEELYHSYAEDHNLVQRDLRCY